MQQGRKLFSKQLANNVLAVAAVNYVNMEKDDSIFDWAVYIGANKEINKVLV